MLTNTTVMCERPNVTPHNPPMRANISRDLQTDTNNSSAKADTQEKLGFTGRQAVHQQVHGAPHRHQSVPANYENAQ